MASRKIEDLHPIILPLYNDFKNRMAFEKVDFIVTCTWRSLEEQEALWERGRKFKNGIWSIADREKVVTWVRPGNSAHNFMVEGKPAALAFDIAILTRGKLNWDTRQPEWETARQLGKKVGLNNLFPKESAHFEYPDWRTVGIIKKTT